MSAPFLSFPCPRCSYTGWTKRRRFRPLMILLCCCFGLGFLVMLLDNCMEWLFNRGIWPKYNACARCGFEARERRGA